MKALLKHHHLMKQQKFRRHVAALEESSLTLRPRSVRVLNRVCQILHEVEEEALASRFTLLPNAVLDVSTLRGAGATAPTSLAYEGAVAAHCDTLRARIDQVIKDVAMAVDEEWAPLNRSQEPPPLESPRQAHPDSPCGYVPGPVTGICSGSYESAGSRQEEQLIGRSSTRLLAPPGRSKAMLPAGHLAARHTLRFTRTVSLPCLGFLYGGRMGLLPGFFPLLPHTHAPHRFSSPHQGVRFRPRKKSPASSRMPQVTARLARASHGGGGRRPVRGPALQAHLS